MTETPTVAPPVDEAPPAQEQRTQADYFGFQETHKHYLPDGVSYFEFITMNEGAKAKYQKSTSRDLVLERTSGNARMKVDPATERHELIQACVIDWNLTRGDEPVKFNRIQLGDFLTLASPRIVEDLEKAIRKVNPWLLAEMTVADIDREIENLKEMRDVAEERERGEHS